MATSQDPEWSNLIWVYSHVSKGKCVQISRENKVDLVQP